MLRLLLVTFILTATALPYATAQPSQSGPSALQAEVAGKLPQWLKQYGVPSASVAYISDGSIAWTAVAGEQSPGVPATTGTLYNIASLTKPLVAETLLRMASQSKFGLDEALASHWVDPDVANNPWNRLLTPRLCLSHQTGLPNWRGSTSNKKLSFAFEPGTQTQYSGEGYMYVAHFAEIKSGEPFEKLAQEYVLRPIGLENTAFTTQKWFDGREAVPYGKDGVLEDRQHTDTFNAANHVRTTPSDYGRFILSVMRNDGLTAAIASQRLVITRNWMSNDLRDKACSFEAPKIPCHLEAGMGLGWQVVVHNGVTIVDHAGANPGYKALAFFVPSRRMGAVIFTNGENGTKVIAEIVRLLYSDPVYSAMKAQ